MGRALGPDPAEKAAPGGHIPVTGIRAWAPLLIAGAGLLALIPAWGPNLLLTDTPLFGFAAWPQVNRVLPWILFLLLPCLDFRLLRPSPLLALAAGYVAIASLRGVWWDYYFLEIGLLAFLLALDGAPSPALPRLSLALLALSLIADVGYAYLYKIQTDKLRLAVIVMERLEREGRARPEALTGGSFGHLGWQLFGYYISHDGRNGGELHGFLGYVRRDRIRIDAELPWRRSYKGPLPPGADSLGGGTCRIGFATVRYRVADIHGPQADLPVLGNAMAVDPDFVPPRYPLDDREWRELIRPGAGR